MKYYIRFVDLNRWLRAYSDDNPPKFKAKVVGDFRIDFKNKISVFALEDIQDTNTLDKIILAFAVGRPNVSQVEYIVLKENELNKLDFPIKLKTGKTLIAEANEKHYDLEVGTIDKLIKLAEYIYPLTESTRVVNLRKIRQMILDELEKGTIRKEDLNCTLREKLDNPID